MFIGSGALFMQINNLHLFTLVTCLFCFFLHNSFFFISKFCMRMHLYIIYLFIVLVYLFWHIHVFSGALSSHLTSNLFKDRIILGQIKTMPSMKIRQTCAKVSYSLPYIVLIYGKEEVPITARPFSLLSAHEKLLLRYCPLIGAVKYLVLSHPLFKD